ncbi:MAG: hypothetical protein NTW19_14695, partial [Planctomycetota bacterium]|nr:hypothetical protein [Planctomycetota bacterium]
MRFTHLPLVVAFLVLSFSIRPTLVLAQSQNMLGHQSQNEGISVLLAPPVVKIDGDLSEWDWSSRIWVFADSAMRSRFSVEAAAMWDKENLYLAAKWKDPTPMFNTVDPEIDPYEGWKSDSWQVRVRTDKITHVTTWFHTPKAMPVVQIAYGKSLTEPFGGDGAFWVGKPHETNLGRGIEMAYKKDADGQGCTQEIKIPWVLLCEKPPTYKVGDKVQLGFEFLWGDPSGRSWPIHRYADNMQPGMTSREFYFTNFKAWGSAELFPAGHVPVREYVGDSDRLAGTIPVVATIPKASARFTLVIEDESGKRVRNLIGDGDPNDYAAAGGKPAGETRQVTVMWDGLDDKGKPVSPGKYRMRGLTHKGLGAEYEMCFYNPGTPPWPTAKGDGAWGADHSGPAAVAVGGGQTFIGSPVVEGGSGLIALDADGRKTWGEKRGVEKVAADGKYVYAVGRNSYMGNAYCLNRYAAKDGAYQPFVKDGKPLAFDLRIDTLFVPVLADAADAAAESDSDDAPAGDTGNLLNNVAVTAMAVQDGKLAVALNAGKIVLLDAATSELLMAFNAKKVSALAFGPRASLRVVADGALNEVEYDFSQLAPGRTIAADHLPKLKPLPTPGLGTAGAIAVDAEGNTLIADRGPDAQVKAYSREGKLAYTAGKKGGRSLRGTFDPQGMRDVVAVACDAKGQIWAVEGGNTPRRASVWGRDGKLVRDYIGNTNYSGTGCYLHDQDPSLAYCGPMEFKLDRTQNTATLTRVLWVPDPAAGEDF